MKQCVWGLLSPAMIPYRELVYDLISHKTPGIPNIQQ